MPAQNENDGKAGNASQCDAPRTVTGGQTSAARSICSHRQAEHFFNILGNAMQCDDSWLKVPWLNMDETAIRRFVHQRRGWHLSVSGKKQNRFQAAQRVAPVNMKRCVSLVALITSDATLQACLPQVLLVNTKGEVRMWRKEVVKKMQSETFQIWQEETQWMTAATMQKYVRLLRTALDTAGKERAVLLMDACRAHMAEDIWPVFHECNIRPVVIPAGMTRWLQPLDVYVFGYFKRHLAEVGTAALRRQGEARELPFEEWLQALYQSVTDILIHKDWARTFVRIGCNDAAKDLHGQILDWFNPEQQMPLTHPACEDMHRLYGKTSVDCYAALFPKEYFAHAGRRLHHWKRPMRRLSSKRSIEALS